MPVEGDNLMRSQRAEKAARKRAGRPTRVIYPLALLRENAKKLKQPPTKSE